MPLAKNRELIPVSTQAHKHLKALVAVMQNNGIPTNGTLLASQLILAIPMPEPKAKESKRRTRKAVTAPVAAMPAA